MCRVVVPGEKQFLLIKAFHKSVHNAAFHVGLRHTWGALKENTTYHLSVV